MKMIWIGILLIVSSSFVPAAAQPEWPYYTPSVWNADGSQVAVTTGQTIQIVNTLDGSIQHTLTGHTDRILTMDWSPNGDLLASAGIDQTVRVWNVSDGSLRFTLVSHTREVTMVKFSPNNDYLLSSDFAGMPNLFKWDMQSGQLLGAYQAGSIVDAAINPDGTQFVFTNGPSIIILDLDNFTRIARNPMSDCCTHLMYSLAWSPDGQYIVTGSANGYVTIWDATTLTRLSRFDANPYANKSNLEITDYNQSWVRDVTWSADGNTLLAVSGDGTVRSWDRATGQLLEETQIGPFATATWSPYSARLAVLDSMTVLPATTQASGTANAAAGVRFSVPFASDELLKSVSESCGLNSSITDSVQSSEIQSFTAQVAALPDTQIAPGCRADLLAVAAALQAQ